MRIYRRAESEIQDTTEKLVVVGNENWKIPCDCFECMAIRCIMEPDLKEEENEE